VIVQSPHFEYAKSYARNARRSAIIKVLGLLLAGAVISVAVAWGFAARRASRAMERNESSCFVVWDRPWAIVQQRQLGIIDIWWEDLRLSSKSIGDATGLVAEYNAKLEKLRLDDSIMRLGGRRAPLSDVPRWGTFAGAGIHSDVMMGNDIAFGFPFPCLWMSTTSDYIGNATANERLWGGWLMHGRAETRGNKFTALPYRVITGRFVGNALVYAAMCWALIAVPRWIRRTRRVRRGLCSGCAYPRGTNEVCTECGAALPETSGLTAR